MNFYKRKQKWKYILFVVAIFIATASLLLTNMLVKNLEDFTKDLELDETKQMETWATAIKHLNNMDPNIEGDFSFSMDIIKQNVNIPLILIDECHDILQHRNIEEIDIVRNSYDKNIEKLRIEKEVEINKLTQTESYLSLSELDKVERKKEIRKNYNDKILTIQSEVELKIKPIILSELEKMKEVHKPILIDVLGDEQKLYYQNSDKIYETKAMLNQLRYYPYYQIAFIALFALIAYLIFNAARRSEQNQVWAGMAKETAHQIGTPLSSLMAWVELLKEKEGTEEMTIEMEKDLKRLETITERFSKIGSKAELTDENIKKLINETVSYMEKRFSKNIEFFQNINIKSEKIMLNKVLLIWVIENICNNAADAMKGEGSITLDCTENDYDIQLLISDTGEGIDRNIIKSVFMPGVTSKKRGWGLGLSLAKRIIEEYHNGKIYVKNSTKESGTTFCILLPKKSNTTTS